MSLNATPTADRLHIGIFGRRNAGKSSLINAITGQNLAIVSAQKGTTTDPVYKSMELLPLGPVVIIDTPGHDDAGELGALRVKKAWQVLNKTDIAVLVIDATVGMLAEDEALLRRIRAKNIPAVLVCNKADCVPDGLSGLPADLPVLAVSAVTGYQINALKELLASMRPQDQAEFPLVRDLLAPLDLVVLVIPIDSAAPKGRLILPQQQTIRDILEAGAIPVVCRDSELAGTLAALGRPPRLVITDSQAFAAVAALTPASVELTSFSILFARHKGNLRLLADGARVIDTLREGDRVLIAEGCTHHRQCDDIGTVKLPRWLAAATGNKLDYAFCSGTEFPEDLTPFRLVIHCGGCMLNEREVKYRLQCAADQQVPITNYGTAIAHMHGILPRALEPFRSLLA